MIGSTDRFPSKLFTHEWMISKGRKSRPFFPEDSQMMNYIISGLTQIIRDFLEKDSKEINKIQSKLEKNSRKSLSVEMLKLKYKFP